MPKGPAKRAGALVSPHALMVPRQQEHHAGPEGQRVHRANQVLRQQVEAVSQVVQRLSAVKQGPTPCELTIILHSCQGDALLPLKTF